MASYRFSKFSSKKIWPGLSALLLIMLLTACGDTSQPTSTPAPLPTSDPRIPVPTPTPYPTHKQVAADIPVFGTTIYHDGLKTMNIEAQDNFLAAYKQGKPGQWEAVLYSFEGGVSSSLIVYKGNGKQVTLVVDATHITMASPEEMVVKEYTCQSISKPSNFIEMNGCSDGKETNDWELPVVN